MNKMDNMENYIENDKQYDENDDVNDEIDDTESNYENESNNEEENNSEIDDDDENLLDETYDENEDDDLFLEHKTSNIDDIFSSKFDELEETPTEINFDPKLHIQHLTSNELTKIIINIEEMIYSGVLNIPKKVTQLDFTLNIILNNELNIKIKRPIDINKYIVVNLSQLKIDVEQLKRKLTLLYS